MGKLPKRGEWNHAVGFLGQRHTGKTTGAVGWMLDRRRETVCYLVAHDPNYAIPDKLHDGRSTGVRRYDSIAALSAGIAKHPDGIHVSMERDAVPLILFAHKLARASMMKADPSGKMERPAPPVVVLVDEVANCKQMQPGSLGDDLRDALMLARHKHTAIVWTTQSPMRIHYEFLANSTALHVYRCVGDKAIKRLLDEARMPPAMAAEVPNLPNYRAVIHGQESAANLRG